MLPINSSSSISRRRKVPTTNIKSVKLNGDREKERKKERKRERERKKERERYYDGKMFVLIVEFKYVQAVRR